MCSASTSASPPSNLICFNPQRRQSNLPVLDAGSTTSESSLCACVFTTDLHKWDRIRHVIRWKLKWQKFLKVKTNRYVRRGRFIVAYLAALCGDPAVVERRTSSLTNQQSVYNVSLDKMHGTATYVHLLPHYQEPCRAAMTQLG